MNRGSAPPTQQPPKQPPRLPKRLALAALVGALAGCAATIFLALLNYATSLREENVWLVLGLPLAGLAVGALYYHFGGRAQASPRLLLEEIHEPKEIIPIRLAPLVLVGTLLTHLFGGSAGREGTAVQMGGSLAEGVARFFRVEKEGRRELLMAGLGAGFGAAVGAPLAGVVFGLEVISVGRLRWRGLSAVLIASLFSFLTARGLHAPHTLYPALSSVAFGLRELACCLLGGLAFGLAARLFLALSHGVERAQKRFVRYPPLRPLLGGIAVLALYYALGNLRYAGLGIPVIQEALAGGGRILDPAAKSLATALTVGSGMKGGEFIPLVFIGASLGSLLAGIFSAPAPLLASLGFAAVFGAAANTPLACAVMGAELFGWKIFPYALAANYLAYLVAGPRSVYPGQRQERPKAHLFLRGVARLRRKRKSDLP